MSDTIYSYYNVVVPISVATDCLLTEARKADSLEEMRAKLSRISYIRNLTSKLDAPNRGERERTGRVCVRIERPAKDFTGGMFTYKISYSFCSFMDGFWRKRARDIATNRSLSSKEFTSLTVESPTRLTVREISDLAIRKAHSEPDAVKAPDWFVDTDMNAINIARRRARVKKAA